MKRMFTTIACMLLALASPAEAGQLGSELVTDGSFAAASLGSEMLTTANCTRADAADANSLSGWAATYGSGHASEAGNWGGGLGSYHLSVVMAWNSAYTQFSAEKHRRYSADYYIYKITDGYSGLRVWDEGLASQIAALASNSVYNAWEHCANQVFEAASSNTHSLRLITSTNPGSRLDDLSLKKYSATNWTEGAGWVINTADGKMWANAGSASDLVQTIAFTAGKTYRVAFTVADRTAGSVTPSIGGTSGVAISANGTAVQYLVAGATGALVFSKTDAFDGSITAVTVKSYRHGRTPKIIGN